MPITAASSNGNTVTVLDEPLALGSVLPLAAVSHGDTGSSDEDRDDTNPFDSDHKHDAMPLLSGLPSLSEAVVVRHQALPQHLVRAARSSEGGVSLGSDSPRLPPLTHSRTHSPAPSSSSATAGVSLSRLSVPRRRILMYEPDTIVASMVDTWNSSGTVTVTSRSTFKLVPVLCCPNCSDCVVV